MLALGALAVVVTPFSVWSGGSWSFLDVVFSRILVFFLLVVALASSRRAIQKLLWAAMSGVVLLAGFAISGASIFAVYGGRAYASASYDPNDVAMMMVCTLPLAAFTAVASRGIARVIAAGVGLICLVATILTMSRGGFIGLLLVAILLLFRLGTAGIAPRLCVLVTLVVCLAATAPAKYWEVMSTIWAPDFRGEYLQSGVFPRLELWKRGLQLFIENPLTGVGIGMYEVAEGLSHGGRGKWSAAHNSFLQLATELGLVGFTLFVALIALSIRSARRARRLSRSDPRLRDLGWISAAVETSLYAYVLEGFALSQAYSPMLYFLIGIATALRLELQRRQRPTDPAVASAVTLEGRTGVRRRLNATPTIAGMTIRRSR